MQLHTVAIELYLVQPIVALGRAIAERGLGRADESGRTAHRYYLGEGGPEARGTRKNLAVPVDVPYGSRRLFTNIQLGRVLSARRCSTRGNFMNRVVNAFFSAIAWVVYYGVGVIITVGWFYALWGDFSMGRYSWLIFDLVPPVGFGRGVYLIVSGG